MKRFAVSWDVGVDMGHHIHMGRPPSYFPHRLHMYLGAIELHCSCAFGQRRWSPPTPGLPTPRLPNRLSCPMDKRLSLKLSIVSTGLTQQPFQSFFPTSPPHPTIREAGGEMERRGFRLGRGLAVRGGSALGLALLLLLLLSTASDGFRMPSLKVFGARTANKVASSYGCVYF